MIKPLFDFTLILTGGNRHEDLNRFFHSVYKQDFSGSIEIIFINQGDYKLSEYILPHSSSLYIKILEIKSPKISLSKARNLGLKVCSNAHFIGFPDDDCWYPDNFFSMLENFYHDNSSITSVCTHVFDPVLKKDYGGKPRGKLCKVSFYNLFYLVISVGIFIRHSVLINSELYFNEKLGAGTLLGSGEETEFISRIILKKSIVVYNGNLSVYHPAPEYVQSDILKFHNYARGHGYLCTSFILKGKYIVLIPLLDILLRSIAGYFFYIFNKNNRNLYLMRLVGLVGGIRLCLKESLHNEII